MRLKRKSWIHYKIYNLPERLACGLIQWVIELLEHISLMDRWVVNLLQFELIPDLAALLSNTENLDSYDPRISLLITHMSCRNTVIGGGTSCMDSTLLDYFFPNYFDTKISKNYESLKERTWWGKFSVAPETLDKVQQIFVSRLLLLCR